MGTRPSFLRSLCTQAGEQVGRSQYGGTRGDGSSNLIQCETAFLDFSLTAGSSEGLARGLST